MKALLLIGLQVDFLPHGPAEVPGSQQLAPLVNQLAEAFGLVAAANFHLPANHVIFAGNHPWRYPGQVVEAGGHPTLLHPIFCVQDSFGASVIPGIEMEKISFAAEMGTDATIPPYSAFFDARRERDTGLEQFLKAKNVTEIFLAGMPLEAEVWHTVQDAVSLGFEPVLISDACLPRKKDAGISTLEKLKKLPVRIVPSNKIVGRQQR